MRGEPPENLARLLARLKLANAAELRAVAPRVRRLAGDLPDFESVWVDALAQARVLTPFQSSCINAGQAERLLRGPYVPLVPLASPHYAACFSARHVETGRLVRLYWVERAQQAAEVVAGALARLVETGTPLRGPTLCVAEESGIDSGGAWAVCPTVDGVTAADWMIENGRLPPPVVLQIAREMAQRLADLGRHGLVHGDLGAAGLIVQRTGHIALPMPGLRGVVRASEGYSFGDLQPQAYDYLAPERVAEGSAPTVASDLYAAGALWWHLLAGRTPLGGGDSLGKLKAAHAARIADIRHWAPHVPDTLSRAIEWCLARDPAARPESFGHVAQLLGPPSSSGCSAVARMLAGNAQGWRDILPARAPRRARRSTLRKVVTAAGILAVISTLLYAPHWRNRARKLDVVTATAPAFPTKQPVAGQEAPRETELTPVPPEKQEASKVTLATAIEPASQAALDLVLSADEPQRLEALDVEPHQRVRGPAGKRPLLVVPQRGLAIAPDSVHFEGIDFVWQIPADELARPRGAPAMLVVEAAAVEFEGCSFSSTTDVAPVAIALRWHEGAGGEVRFRDCVFRSLGAVIEGEPAAGMTIGLDNALCIASGPIVRLLSWPKADESLTLTLDRVTTRGDSSVLECRYARSDASAGHIAIAASDSALDTKAGGGLLWFVGQSRPDDLLKSIVWNGQGSLVTPTTAIALWQRGSKKPQTLAEDELEIGGLVRSRVDFAGSAQGPPTASRVVHWQVPLRSDDPPGANPQTLSFPRNR